MINNNSDKKDISIFENSLRELSENINNVADDVVDINAQMSDFNEQVDTLKQNVKSLEQEIKNFIMEVRGNSIISNSQNEMLSKSEELTAKFNNYDLTRDKFFTIIDSIDSNTICKQLLINQSEQSSLNTSDYYLSYCLIALCSWFKNEKKGAKKALNKALSINDNKTSLLFCLIHLKLNRNKTAIKWLKRYLDNQNANDMDTDILSILENLSNISQTNDLTSQILNYINEWIKETENSVNINNYQTEKWKNFFEECIEVIDKNDYPFSSTYIQKFENMVKSLSASYSYNNAYSKFLSLINNDNLHEHKNILEMINSTIYSYEGEELELRKSIIKNRLIIECKGNVEEANKKFNTFCCTIETKNNFGNIIANTILERNDISLSTKLLCIFLMKKNIMHGFEEAFYNDDDIVNSEIEIKINDWVGITKDGSNEKELEESLTEYVKEPFAKDAEEQQFFSIKSIYCAIFIVIGIILLFIKLYVGLIVMFVGGGMLIHYILETSKNRQNIIDEYNDTIEKYLYELDNTLAEIVDIKFICKRNLKYKQELIEYINSIDIDNYINFK